MWLRFIYTVKRNKWITTFIRKANERICFFNLHRHRNIAPNSVIDYDKTKPIAII